MLFKSLTNCNRNFRGQPAGLNWLIVAAVYIYTCSSHDSRKIDTKRNPPIPTFIWVPILQFSRTMESLLQVINYFENNHDDGTVTDILSHLNTRSERSNDRKLIHRHRGRHCINY